jgi:hypothetical protein
MSSRAAENLLSGGQPIAVILRRDFTALELLAQRRQVLNLGSHSR